MLREIGLDSQKSGGRRERAMRFSSKFSPELCVSKDSARYVLQKCFLRGNLLYATDGRRIVQIPVERDTEDVDCFIPVEVIQAARSLVRAKRGKKSDDKDVSIRCLKDGFYFDSKFGETHVKHDKVTKDHNYPNLSQIISKSANRRANAISLNVNLLYGAATALGSSSVTISFDDEVGAIIIEPLSTKESVAHAVLMPVRTE